MLSVCQPERRHLLRHPASPPSGSVPRWLSAAAQAAPAGLATPTVGDVAALALRRAYERLDSGAAVSVQDVVALLKLAREAERDSAGAGSAARWQATLQEVCGWLGATSAMAGRLSLPTCAPAGTSRLCGASAASACPACGSSLTGSSSVSSLSSQTMAG